MKRLFTILTAITMLLALSSCGPTVQDYSENLKGIWQRDVEEEEDGFVERGTLYLSFDSIEPGNDRGGVSAMYTGRLDGSDNSTFSADFFIEVFGIYTIDPEDAERPLQMEWDTNSLTVNIENVKIEDFQADFQSMMNDIASTLFFGSGDTKAAIAAELKKNIARECRNELRARNDDPGWYELSFGDSEGPDYIIISGTGFSYRFDYSSPSNFVTEIQVDDPAFSD